jgi:hypothetical protein
MMKRALDESGQADIQYPTSLGKSNMHALAPSDWQRVSRISNGSAPAQGDGCQPSKTGRCLIRTDGDYAS